MAEVEELLDGVAVRLPAAAEIRAKATRRTRRRTTTAVVCSAVLMAIGAWAVLPTGADQQRRHDTVATAPDNPFRKDGLIQTWRAGEVPLYDQWHWTEGDGSQADAPAQDGLLPQVGLAGACPGSLVTADTPDQICYSQQYKGSSGALAQQRIVEFDDTATAGEQLRKVQDELTACGLRPTSQSSSSPADGPLSWSGTVKGDRTMRVFLQRWNSWVSVTEVLDGRRTP
ncbi:hypothetical protein [Streptomyces sp. NPDC002785]|uniref:hypothetical protein n=1 Tax=Streptomyces sp. NPDC002785 TaxID=3154543 RepID=UPI00331E6A78